MERRRMYTKSKTYMVIGNISMHTFTCFLSAPVSPNSLQSVFRELAVGVHQNSGVSSDPKAD